jgi:hypothetical protein
MQWELDCRGRRGHGTHEDDRCPATQRLVRVDLPSAVGGRDDVLYLTAEEVWDHLDEREHEWGSLPVLERARYMVVCVPGLLAVTPGVERAGEWVGLEGFSEAYGALPFDGPLTRQPPWMLQAFSVVRSTRNQYRIAEMRQREADAMNRLGAGNGESHG